MTNPESNDPLHASLDGAAHPDGDQDALDLARRAQAGDEQALNQLFARYQEPLHRIVRIRMGGHLRRQGGLESMDVVQRAFAKAYTKLSAVEIRDSRSILNWLARIAEHQIHDANDYISAEKRDWRRTSSLEGGGSSGERSSLGYQPEAMDTLPDQRALRNELQETIDQAMMELKEEHREVILLRDYSGLEWAAIVEQLDRGNIHAVQELHRRARIRLARILGSRLGEME